MKKVKIIAWISSPTNEDCTKVMYARTKLGYKLKMFYAKCFYDYVKVEK